MLQYQQLKSLPDVHTKGIVKAAFSCQGTYLATAGLDGRVCVWNLAGGELLCSFRGASSALVVEWVGPDENSLLCGSEDGYIAKYNINGVCIRRTSMSPHTDAALVVYRSQRVPCASASRGKSCARLRAIPAARVRRGTRAIYLGLEGRRYAFQQTILFLLLTLSLRKQIYSRGRDRRSSEELL